MAPVEKTFSQVKERLIHIACIDESEIMRYVRDAFASLSADYFPKIFFNSYKFCYQEVQRAFYQDQL
jgi:hypothetical protein